MCDAACGFECRPAVVSGIPVVKAVGEIDLATAPVFREALLNQVTGGAHACLIVDLAHVPFMDSEGLRVLLGVRVFFPGGIALVGVQPTLSRMFAVCGTDRLFLQAPTREEAAAHLRRRPLDRRPGGLE